MVCRGAAVRSRAPSLPSRSLSSAHARAQDSLAFKGAPTARHARRSQIVSEASARGLPSDHIVSKVQFALVVHAPPARNSRDGAGVSPPPRARPAAHRERHPVGRHRGGRGRAVVQDSEDILTRIHAAAPNRPIAVPIGLLTQLVANAVPAEHAGKIVIELMRRGASPKQFADLGNDVNSDVQRGARGAESADIRFRGLTPLLSPGGGTTGDLTASSPASSGPRKP